MGFKERIERLKENGRVKKAVERQRLDQEERRKELEKKMRVRKIREALESRKIPEIMDELNKELLDGKGELRYEDDRDRTSIILEWAEDNDFYIEAKAFYRRTEGIFSGEKIMLSITGADELITTTSRNYLEEAFAKAFLHHGSHASDNRARQRSMELDNQR